MFKNITVFRVADLPAMTSLIDGDWPAFTPCGPTQPASIGWVPPRGQHETDMVEIVGGQIILRACIETKQVPPATLDKAVDVLAATYNQRTGLKASKKMRKELKDIARLELLPQAFPRQKRIPVWIDHAAGLLVIGSASNAAVDAVVTLLVQTLEGIKVSPINTADSPMYLMTSWLQDGETHFPEFTLDRACELRADDEMRSTVRYARSPLDTDEVKAHIAAGLRARSLAMTWNSRVSFTLTACLQLRGIEFLDVVFAERAADVADQFAADAAISTGELGRVIADLIEALDGEVVAEGGAA